MRILAIETATSACSVALIEDGFVVDAAHMVVGRGHAERLLPMIASLERGGRADVILVDRGPGSFTGIRVGIAAARGLGFGWGASVRAFASLALIAAIDAGSDTRWVAIEGGHGELFVARYAGNPVIEVDPPRSMPVEAALAEIGDDRVVGNAAAWFPFGSTTLIDPDARAVVALPKALAHEPPSPFYGRAADAKPMAVAGRSI